MVVERLNRRNARVKLPKLGWVRFRMSRALDGETIRSATLRRDGRHWFVSFLVEDGKGTLAQHRHPGTAVGVDRGVVVAVATSDGELRDRELLTEGERRRALRLQRTLSRSAKRSRNRAKTRAALGEIRARERRRRQDFCAQTAHQLTTANAVVVIEDLKTKQMTRRAKGTLAEPGRNVNAKSGLNLSRGSCRGVRHVNDESPSSLW
jgi:putative transposase